MKFNNNSVLFTDASSTKYDNHITNENSKSDIFNKNLLKCLTSIYNQASLNNIADYLVYVEKRISDNSQKNINVYFADGTNYNKEIYDIVLDNCKKFNTYNFDFIISKKDDNNQIVEEMKLYNKLNTAADNDYASDAKRLLDYSDYFKYITVSKSNHPLGNLADYLLIKQFAIIDNND